MKKQNNVRPTTWLLLALAAATRTVSNLTDDYGPGSLSHKPSVRSANARVARFLSTQALRKARVACCEDMKVHEDR